MIAMVSTGQVQPGKLDDVLRMVEAWNIRDITPGYKRYDFLVNRAENRTLGISLLETQADVDAMLAWVAQSEFYARAFSFYMPSTVPPRSFWEVVVQKTPGTGPGEVALVSFGQVRPGKLDEAVRLVDQLPLYYTTPGFKRYDFCVNRAENKTLAISLFGSQAELDAFRASPQLAEVYAQVRPMMVPEATVQGVWEVALQK